LTFSGFGVFNQIMFNGAAWWVQIQKQRERVFVIASVGEFKRESKKSVHEHHE